MRGPVYSSYLDHVHIISDSYGVIASGGATITNSVIEAPVCVQSSGMGLHLTNNTLDCNLGVEYTGGIVLDNYIVGNRVRGRLTNR